MLALLQGKTVQPDRLSRALLLLKVVAGLPGLAEELGRLGAVKVAVTNFLDTSAPEAVRVTAVRALATLGHGHSANQSLIRKEGGVKGLVWVINTYSAKRQQTLKNGAKEAVMEEAMNGLRRSGVRATSDFDDKLPALVVAAVNCIWIAIVGQ